jgi:hypothetical protein
MSQGDAPAVERPAAPGEAPAAIPLAPGIAAPERKKRCWWRFTLGLVLLLVLALGTVVAGLLYFNLERHEVFGRFVRDRLVAGLQERIDPSLTLSIGAVDIERQGHETRVQIGDVEVRDAKGRSLLHAPAGVVRIATVPLIGLQIVPTGITLKGLNADVSILENGEVSISDAMGASPEAGAPPAVITPPLVRLQQALDGLFAGVATMRQAVGGRLPDVAVAESRLTLRDLRSNRVVVLKDVAAQMQTGADGASSAWLKFDAGAPVDLAMRLSPPGETQHVSLQTGGLAIRALIEAQGASATAIDAEARMTIAAEAEVGANGVARAATVTLGAGPMVLDIDRKMAPVPVEKAGALLRWGSGKETIEIAEAGLVSEGSVVRLTGAMSAPEAGSTGWTLRLADAGSSLAPLAAGDRTITFDALSARLSVHPAERRLVFDKVEARVGTGSAEVAGAMQFDDSYRPGLDLNVTVRETDGRTALRLWPGFAAPEVRTWLVQQLRSGHLASLDIKLAMPPDILDAALNDRPLPPEAVALKFAAAKVALVPAPGLPVVQNLAGTGTVTGQAVAVDLAGGAYIDAGQGRRITLSDGSFTVPEVSKKPADGRLKLKIAGPVEGALEVIKAPGLQQHLPKGVEAIKARGVIEGDLNVHLRLSPHMAPNDTRVGLAAQLKNLTIDKGFGDEKIEAGVFTLNAEKDNFSLKGDAKVFGTPAAIEVKGAGKAPAVANLNLVLDDAARARKGIVLGPNVTGPVAVKIAVRLDGENEDVTLDADLTRLAMGQIVPGLAKKAGAPGRLRGIARELDGGGWALEKMELDAGGVMARGSVQVGKDGGFAKASLSSLKFAPGDAMQVEADRAGGVLRLNVRANSVDARPFLKSVLTGGIEKTGGRDIDLALRSTVLSGFNAELVANADVKLAMRGGALQSFSLTGRFDAGPITARLQPGGGRNGTLSIASDDAGAFLRFFDIYNRMRGGRLELNAALGAGTQTGGLVVRNFILRDEPAMRRLVAAPETTATGGGDTARLQQELARSLKNGQEVPFNRMSVQFARTPGRLDLKDGALIGPEVGGNVEGRLDYARDVVNLSGTFVPAYSLNNALANVPLVGPIITGGRSEGLFAVRYHITGRVSAPTLEVNPLTAIAPGFLRRLIDFRRGSGVEPPPVR